MQGFEETLTEAVHMGFLAAVTGLKNAFIYLIEVALTDMVQLGLTDKVFYISSQRWTQSEILVSELAEELCKDSALLK